MKRIVIITILLLLFILTGCTVKDQLGTVETQKLQTDSTIETEKIHAELELTKIAETNSANVKIAEINANSAIVIAKDTNSSNVQVAYINGKSWMDSIFWIILGCLAIVGIGGFFYSRRSNSTIPTILLENPNLLRQLLEVKESPKYYLEENINERRR